MVGGGLMGSRGASWLLAGWVAGWAAGLQAQMVGHHCLHASAVPLLCLCCAGVVSIFAPTQALYKAAADRVLGLAGESIKVSEAACKAQPLHPAASSASPG